MQPIPLTHLTEGINRLHVKGGANPQSLYDLVNAYITNEGTIQQREGTINIATLSSSTAGLFSFDGKLNVVANTTGVSVPSGFEVNVLVNPVNPALTIETVWFAQPFMGFPYIVAEFSDGSVYHYWLQYGGTWQANHVYMTGDLVIPISPNGLAYEATSSGYITSAGGTTALLSLPVWTAQTAIAEGYTVQPTTYTGYIYRAVVVEGTTPHTGSTEPVWPVTAGGTIQEFGDFDTTSTDSGGNVVSTPTLSTSITDRYGDSGDISGQTGTASFSPSTVPAAATVTTWAPGTTYAPGAVVQPSTSQGAFVNAIPNGDFEAGNTDWAEDTGWSIGTSLPYQGTYAAEYSASQAGNFFMTMSTAGAVTPGTSVTATCYAQGDSDGEVILCLNWYDSGSTFISRTTGTQTAGGGGVGTGSYTLIGVTGTAPAGAAGCKVSIMYTTGSHSARAGRADLVVWNLETPAPVSNFLFEAVQAGAATSGSTEPAWPTVAGNTVIDGGVTWQAIGTSIITWEAIPIMLSASFSSIATFNAPTGGTGYVPGTYNTVALTGGSGTGATATIVVNGSGHVATVTLVSGGESYAPGDTLTTANGNLGGSGSGFSVVVATVNAGAGEPAFPTTIGTYVSDPSTFTASDSTVINTSISWLTTSRVITDINNPQTVEVALGASHVFAGDNDIVSYSAAVNPTDWTSANNAGYLPTGLNNYGANPVTAIGLYRSNLMVFNDNGYQMWEIDPDPANMALLDAEPIGCPYTRSLQSVANDLLLLTEVGVRNIGLTGATANMQVGNTGQPVDPIVVAQIAAATYTPISLYYPGRGQYWLIFGPQAFVLTINGNGNRTWSRYIFPAAITDWTIQNGVLYLRTATNLVWEFSAAAQGVDDQGASNTAFSGVVQTPYLDMQGLGINKMLIGLDLVGTGAVGIQIGFDQADITTFNDNAGFSSSLNVTPLYSLTVDDTVPGEPIPFPVNAPSLTLILTFPGSQAWSLQAANFYVQGQTGAGATG